MKTIIKACSVNVKAADEQTCDTQRSDCQTGMCGQLASFMKNAS